MGITFRLVEVETGCPDHEGLLILDNGRLLAILVRLSEIHAELAGLWNVEYGPSFSDHPKMFESVEDATTWIRQAKYIA